jgi:hypothetical protein
MARLGGGYSGGAWGGAAEGLQNATKTFMDMRSADQRDKAMALSAAQAEERLALERAADQRAQEQFNLQMDEARRANQPLSVGAIRGTFSIPEAADYAQKVATALGYIANPGQPNATIRRKDATAIRQLLQTDPEHVANLNTISIGHYQKQVGELGTKVQDIDRQIRMAGTSSQGAGAGPTPAGMQVSPTDNLKALLTEKAATDIALKKAKLNLERAFGRDKDLMAYLAAQKKEMQELKPGHDYVNTATGEVIHGPAPTDTKEVWGQPFAGPGGALLQQSNHGQIRAVLGREREGAGGGSEGRKEERQDRMDFGKEIQRLQSLKGRYASIQKGYDPITGMTIPQDNIKQALATVKEEIDSQEEYTRSTFPKQWQAYRGGKRLGGGAGSTGAPQKGTYGELYKIAAEAGSSTKAIAALQKLGYAEGTARQIVQQGIQGGYIR